MNTRDFILPFISPQEAAQLVTDRVKKRRLAENYSRKTLAERSGVSEPSIKRFETTGEIAFASLLKLAFALDCMEEFGDIFPPKKIVSIAEITKKPRARGRG
jgi:transcriptional regulator with XRE-family HTH domain